MVASYSELYEEGEVEHINGPSHPPYGIGICGMSIIDEGDGNRMNHALIQRPGSRTQVGFYSQT